MDGQKEERQTAQAEAHVDVLSAATLKALVVALLRQVAHRDPQLAARFLRVLRSVNRLEVEGGSTVLANGQREPSPEAASARARAFGEKHFGRGQGRAAPHESRHLAENVRWITASLHASAKPPTRTLIERLWRQRLGQGSPVPTHLVQRVTTCRTPRAAAIAMVAEAHGVDDVASLRRRVSRAKRRP